MSRSPVVSELYKDKVEIVLDSRQIFYLFFGGSVIVGLVFVLGIMVGRRVEARGHLQRAQASSTVDPLAALDRLAGGAGLSFHGALRENSPRGEPNAANVRADDHANPAKTTDSKTSERPVTKPDQDRTDVDGAEGDKAGKAENKKLDGTKAGDTKPDAKVVEGKKPDEAKKSETKKTEDKKPADKKADSKKTDDPGKSLTKDDKKPESKSKYALQLSSFQVRSEAEAYLAQVKTNGFGAYITEAEVDGKTYYRVRIGNYRSLDAANDAKPELEKAMKKSATVMKL